MIMQEVCLRAISLKGLKGIRRYDSTLEPYATQIIEQTRWLPRDNFTERVFCIAYDIQQSHCCNITSVPIWEVIKTKPLHRFDIQQIRNMCVVFPKSCMPPSILDSNLITNNYDSEYCESVIKAKTLKTILRIPILINHCWNWLRSNDQINTEEIYSDEECCYLYYNKSLPNRCLETGNKCKFNIHNFTYTKYESIKTGNLSQHRRELLRGRKITDKTIQQRRDTNLKMYGVTCTLTLSSHKELRDEKFKQTCKRKVESRNLKAIEHSLKIYGKIPEDVTPYEKYKHTCNIKYGVDSVLDPTHLVKSNPNFKSDALVKAKETWIAKYGVDNPNKSPDIRVKIRETVLRVYGSYKNVLSLESKAQHRLNKQVETYYNFSRFESKTIPLFDIHTWIIDNTAMLPWQNVETGERFDAIYYGYPPIGALTFSSLENKIQTLLKSKNINFIARDRQTLKVHHKEIDIYLPEYQIGIECNGDYWHSDNFVDKDYHILKHDICKNVGIRLLQFTETEIVRKFKIVKNIILNTIEGSKIKIHGRKCDVQLIQNTVAKKFYDKYHIQGYINGLYHYGIFYKQRLVSCATFSKDRYNKTTNSWELLRYVSMGKISVYGGLSKILKKFKVDQLPKHIITYSDKRIFSGECYKRSGFTQVADTSVGYFYTNQRSILSRYQCQKHKLPSLFTDVDLTLTEKEIMKNAGYMRVYDCGNYKFEMNIF